MTCSVWLLLVAAVLCLQLGDAVTGLLASSVLLVSVLFHEMAHVWVARVTGGWGDEILAWPLGGLLAPQPALTRRAQLSTALAGPAVNALMCVLSGITVYRAGVMEQAINPLTAWPALNTGSGLEMARSVMILVFTINWTMLVVNLIPVHPFDGGRVLEWQLSEWLVEETAADLQLRLGALLGVLGFASGLLWDNPGWHGTWLVALGAFVLVWNLEEMSMRRSVEDLESALLEYELGFENDGEDFSEIIDSDQGLLDRWRERREETRLQEEVDRQRETERRVDGLLQKVHRVGFDGLDEEEKRQLRQASREYRDRPARPEETV